MSGNTVKKLSFDEIALLNKARGEGMPQKAEAASAKPEAKPDERPRARWDAVNKTWNTRLVPKLTDKYVVVVSTLMAKEEADDLSTAQETIAAKLAEKQASLGGYNTQMYFCGDKGGSGAEIARKDAEISELKAQIAQLMTMMQAKA